jgi:hypothetical protein
MKPIRIFWNELSHRFYATQAYKQVKPGVVMITGKKYDVTDQIAEAIIKHNLTFTEKP